MPNVVSLPSVKPKVLEFFAGIGLARMGLEKAGFQVVWSNDTQGRVWSSSQWGVYATRRPGVWTHEQRPPEPRADHPPR